ncbi:MAG: LEA type 2 family protein [Magnetococcales bacterium]|nr:LEA type 2 family protein [Magnetococcales bacterium]
MTDREESVTSLVHRLKSQTLALLLLLAGMGWLVSGCGMLPDLTDAKSKLVMPRLSLVDVQLPKKGKLSIMEPHFKVRLRVENPNDVEFPISGIECRIELHGMAFAAGKSTDFFTVPAKGSSDFEMEFSTEIVKAMKQASTLLRKGDAPVEYRISGIIHVEIPYLGAVPFDKSGQLNNPIRGEE